MNLFSRALSKIFKSGNQQELTKIKPLIAAINEKEAFISTLKDEEFKERTFKLKNSIKSNRELIKEILPESFALVREASKRTLGGKTL